MKKQITIREYPYPIFYGLEIEAVDLNTNLIASALFEIYKNEKRDIQFVCTGSSGIVIAYQLAKKLSMMFRKWKCEPQLTICYIRKEGERAHHQYTAVYSEDVLIVVDDFVSSGATLQRIQHDLAKRAGRENNAHERVECVCARNCDEEFATSLFPNVKHILL